MYCINCTREIRDESNYCIYCGEMVNFESGLIPTQRPQRGQVVNGFIGSFILMIVSWVIAVYLALENYRHDNIIFALIAGLILISILPTLILLLTKRTGLGKGTLFGTLSFYLISLLIILAFASSI